MSSSFPINPSLFDSQATSAMEKNAKSDLLARMYRAGVEALRAAPVQRVDEFEDGLGKHFKKECENLAGKLRSGRVEWRNLVDWVKARLTRESLIRYLETKGGDRFIVNRGVAVAGTSNR